MIKKIKVFSLIISLIVNLCIVPTHISYADTISNPIRKIAIKTTALAVAVGSALGITAVNGWEAYKEKFLDPISSHLRRYEEKDGVIGAYVKDGKTYVSKEMIQDVADYMTENNMYTNIYTSGVDSLFDELLEADGFFDSESFFMSVPYYANIKAHYGKTLSEMILEQYPDYKLIPYYATYKSKYSKDCMQIGAFIVHPDAKYIKVVKSSGYLYINSLTEDLRNILQSNCQSIVIEINSSGISYIDTNICNYTAVLDINYRIGLKEIKVREPAYSVADKGLSGQAIDNWDSAWAQQVIDVLKDIQINTSISADDISSADESQIIDALPLSLPQYGIDGTTADEAMQNTASIPMSQAKSGEVTLSPSAIDALSEAIAKAISEAGTTTGEQTITGEITIPQPVYSGLSSYELDLTDVFPFCIPFDLVDLIKVFSASPEAPQFSIPIKYPTGFNSWGSYDLEVDLSPFDSVASVVRTLETILFILGLLKITRSAMIRG